MEKVYRHTPERGYAAAYRNQTGPPRAHLDSPNDNAPCEGDLSARVRRQWDKWWYRPLSRGRDLKFRRLRLRTNRNVSYLEKQYDEVTNHGRIPTGPAPIDHYCYLQKTLLPSTVVAIAVAHN